MHVCQSNIFVHGINAKGKKFCGITFVLHAHVSLDGSCLFDSQ